MKKQTLIITQQKIKQALTFNDYISITADKQKRTQSEIIKLKKRTFLLDVK